MGQELNDKRRPPHQPSRQPSRAGRAASVVVFLHGYGADGADLLGLAEPLAPQLPHTAFRAPDAPQPSLGNPFGRQWFPIPALDGADPVESARAFAEARTVLHRYLDRVLAEEGLPPAALALVGFSQGTMMSLAVAPERAEALAGVVGFSGRLVDPAALQRARVKPPVFLAHGDQDPMVPFADLAATEAALRRAGFAVETRVEPGMGHGIGPRGFAGALEFLQRHLPSE